MDSKFEIFLESKGLTLTQIRICNLVISGMNNREIAEISGLKLKSIESAMRKIFTKLYVADRIELIIMLSVFIDKDRIKEMYSINDIKTINVNDLKYLLFQNDSCEIKYKSRPYFDYKKVYIQGEKLLIHRPATGQKHGKEYRRDTVNLNKISFIRIKNIEYKII